MRSSNIFRVMLGPRDEDTIDNERPDGDLGWGPVSDPYEPDFEPPEQFDPYEDSQYGHDDNQEKD